MKISVCTCTIRRGFVEEQARMLASQRHKDLEWILIDFAFEERSKKMHELAEDLAIPIKHAPNVRSEGLLYARDICRNRNKALRLAEGDAVIFLDDYAVIPEDFVSQHVTLMEQGAISIGLMHRLEKTITDDIMSNIYEPLKLLAEYEMGRDYRDIRNGEPYMPPPGSQAMTFTGNLGIPRKIFEELNGFDPRFDGSLEDCDFGARARLGGHDMLFNPMAYTINLCTGDRPYVVMYDHDHDIEPFCSNALNKYAGDVHLPENEFLRIEFNNGYRVGVCKICGARTMIDGHELMYHNQAHNVISVPKGLPGGFH